MFFLRPIKKNNLIIFSIKQKYPYKFKRNFFIFYFKKKRKFIIFNENLKLKKNDKINFFLKKTKTCKFGHP
jgi:hypothetical protein